MIKHVTLRFLRRVAGSIPVLAGVVLLLFILVNLAPGDLVDVLGAEGSISDAGTLAQMRAEFGLDQPWYIQLLHYYWRILHLDLGYSARDAQSVLGMILDRLPATLVLMGSALLLAVCAGVILGMLAARHVNTWLDTAVSLFTMIFYAAPSFLVGMLAMLLFSVKLGWLPVSGMETLGADDGALNRALDIGRHLLMPGTALGLFYAAIYARVMRASVLEIHGADFVLTALAKGQTPGRILWRHVFRNAVLPVVTLCGMQFGTLLAGSVVMESVFNWPGVGSLLFNAVQARNMPVVAGILLMTSVVVIVANLLVDLLYSWIDPRIT